MPLEGCDACEFMLQVYYLNYNCLRGWCSHSDNATWSLNDVTSASEDVYVCSATNSAGSSVARTYLDITGTLVGYIRLPIIDVCLSISTSCFISSIAVSNLLTGTCSYSATSKRIWSWYRSPPRPFFAVENSPPINGQSTNHRIAVLWFDVVRF